MKRGLIAFAVILTVSLIAYGTYTSANQVTAEPVVSKYEVGPPDATELLELVNAERAKVGAPVLKVEPILSESAQWKSNDMAARAYYAHDMPGTSANYDEEHLARQFAVCTSISENLMRTDGTSDQTVESWLSSDKGHREAILNATYTKTGVYVTQDGSGLYLVTQLYC